LTHDNTITKLFKNTNIKTAFRTTNTIRHILKEIHTTNIYEQTGIYKLTCMDCKKAYIGQTGRTLNTSIKYKKHIRSNKYNKEDSGYATHILNNAHCYGKIEDITEKIDSARKSHIINIKQNFIFTYTNRIIN
jgi:hypothetical protein